MLRAMSRVRAEFTVFPFQDGAEPPPHARAAIEAIRSAGLDVEVGPFGTAVAGESSEVLQALSRAQAAAIAAGASRVAVSVLVEGVPPEGIPHVGRALGQLIVAAEGQIGRPIGKMTRAQKQHVVQFLHEQGAFELRRSVETVADLLGVSRFTVYNYLDASRDPPA
jgi:uncharacterized protein YqgV (UPF0045/DUF77 family)